MENPPCLPQRIALPALGEEWAVEYRSPASAETVVRVREVSGHLLVVSGYRGDFEACRKALLRWLSRRARRELEPRLREIAERHGFEHGNVTVRQQRTRWGSCSRQGNISLNARLLMMPPEACYYVLLHELCHTVRMDHSPKFWALVEEHDSNYKAHKKLVRGSAKAFPDWLDHEPDEEAM